MGHCHWSNNNLTDWPSSSLSSASWKQAHTWKEIENLFQKWDSTTWLIQAIDWMGWELLLNYHGNRPVLEKRLRNLFQKWDSTTWLIQTIDWMGWELLLGSPLICTRSLDGIALTFLSPSPGWESNAYLYCWRIIYMCSLLCLYQQGGTPYTTLPAIVNCLCLWNWLQVVARGGKEHQRHLMICLDSGANWTRTR